MTPAWNPPCDAEQVFATLRQYYPHERIRPATRFFIEEIMERP